MKKPSTTVRDTCSKLTDLSQAKPETVDEIRSALCREDWAQELFSHKLECSKPELRRCFLAARIFLEQFELEVLNGLSEGISLTDFDELTLNRQKRCELALSEIDLRLCTMLLEARRQSLNSATETGFSLDTEQPRDYPSETH